MPGRWRAARSGGGGDELDKIFIGGIKPQVTEVAIHEHFKQFGAVRRVEILRNPVTFRPRGFGFVTFESPAAVAGAYAYGAAGGDRAPEKSQAKDDSARP